MREMAIQTWRLPLRLNGDTLLAELATLCPLRSGIDEVQNCVFRDSFDWRLYRAGFFLCAEDGFWRLLRRGDGQEQARGRLRGGDNGQPLLPLRLPQGQLRQRLSELLGPRALLPLVRVRRTRRELHAENADGKIVVRLVLEAWRVDGGTAARSGKRQEERLLRLEEVRGYEADWTAIQALLPRLGLTADGSLEQIVLAALRASGREPLDYSAKFQAVLLPEMPAILALRQIGGILLEIMRRNEAGIVQDIDPEFLHDFRVSVRRVRAALGQFKGVLAPELLEEFLREFSWLGQLSNPARDLDVLLAREKDWLELLPAELREGLRPFFAGLARRRRREYRRLTEGLASPRYRALLERWQGLVRGQEDGTAAGPRAQRPALRLARRIIGRRWRRILADGSLIDESSPPEALHRLRIQGKKMRYALEFFRSVLPEEACAALIDRLKRLQDNLGRYNDLAVQETVVREFLAGLAGKTANLEAAAAAGGLLACLAQQREEVRQGFAEVFADFAGNATTALVQLLLERDRPEPHAEAIP